MLLDARELREGAVVSADVCIAGSGPAGITLATELVDSGLDVVLLESGGFSFDDDAQALNDGAMTGIQTWTPREMRVRAFGGTSGHWQGFCRPLGREDFERRDWVEGSGWPIDYDTLEPFYIRAQATCQVGAFDYDARRMSERIDVPLLTDDESVLEHNFYRISPPTRFGTHFRSAIEDAGNVRAYVYATLLDIRLSRDLASVERFDCSTLDGKRFSVEAGASCSRSAVSRTPAYYSRPPVRSLAESRTAATRSVAASWSIRTTTTRLRSSRAGMRTYASFNRTTSSL